MPTGYDYYALTNLYIGFTLAFSPGQLIPDSTVTSQGWVTGTDVNPIGTPPPTSQTLVYVGTPTDGQFVMWQASSGTWIPTTGGGGSGIPASTVTTKGDLLAATASATVARLGVGSNGQVHTAYSTATPGVKWATATGGGGPTGLPSYVTTAANRYDPATNWYNLKPINTRRVRLSIGRCSNGGQAEWLYIGDSGGAGCTQAIFTPNTFDRLHAPPLSMAKQLAVQGIPQGGTGIIRCVDGPANFDSRWSSSGTWSNQSAYISSVANAAFITCTLGAGDFPSISTYTIAELWYLDVGVGPFTVSVNGASSGVGFASVTMTNTSTVKRIIVPGVTVVSGSTLKVTKSSTANTGFIGVNFYTPDGGLVIHNASQSGATASGTGHAAWGDSSLTGLGLYYQRIGGPPAGGRVVTDAVTTATSTTSTSATAAYTADDVGASLTRASNSIIWPENPYVSAVGSGTSITTSVAAVQSLTAQTVTIDRQPDVVFIALGGNDLNLSSTTTTINTVIAAITTIAGYWPNSDIVLVVEPQKADSLITAAIWEQYAAALYTLADLLNVPLFDYRDRIGSFAIANGNGQYGDGAAHMISGASVDWGKTMANGLVA